MIYTYEKNVNTGKNQLLFVMGVRENKISTIFNKFAYLLEWFSIGALFYLNSAFIHSRLFSIFIFIVGILLMFTLGFKKKLSTKEEFLNKVNEILNEDDQCENQ